MIVFWSTISVPDDTVSLCPADYRLDEKETTRAGKDNSENSDDPSDATQGTDTDKKIFKIPDWIRAVFWCLLFALCIPVQGYARIHRKRILWNRGKPNAKPGIKN